MLVLKVEHIEMLKLYLVGTKIAIVYQFFNTVCIENWGQTIINVGFSGIIGHIQLQAI